MSPLGIALLAAAAVLVVAVEWPRIAHRTPGMRRGVEFGRSAKRRRPTRTRSRAKLEVVKPESEEFARSVERDLAALPTIDEHDVKRR
jgi:hypothetical protein